MLKLAYENLTANPIRTGLSLLGLVIGVITIISLISVTAGLRGMVSDLVAEMQGMMVQEKDAIDQPWSRLPADYEQKIEAMTGVKDAFPEVWALITTVEGRSAWGIGMSAAFLAGMDPAQEKNRKGKFYGADLKRGRYLTQGDRYSAVIGDAIAETFNKDVGSTLEVDGVDFRVIGVLEKNEITDGAIGVPIDIAREFGGMPAGEVSTFTVQTHSPGDEEKIAKAIEVRFTDTRVFTSQSMMQYFDEQLGIMNLFLFIISIIAIIIAGVGILNTMIMSVMERMNQFGVMKAIGWTDEDIITLVLIESLMLGVVGAVVGVILSYALVEAVKTAIGFPLRITIDLIALAFLFSVSMGVIGGVYPAWKASRMDPIDAIRAE